MNVEEFKQREVSRRQFLGRSAQRAAGMAVGVVGLGSTVAAVGLSQSGSPMSKIGLGIIGVRNQGRQIAGELLKIPDVEVRGLCDVDESQFAPSVRLIAESTSVSPTCVTDFRRLLDDPAIDAVVIATPDHWHVPMTLAAVQSGRDVYLESPATHSIEEGEFLIGASQSSHQILQIGLQQRSGTHFRSAVDLVKSGRLGRVRLAKAWVVHRRKPIGHRSPSDIPEHVDYQAWLGPAPARPFQLNRFHFNWRWFWDYGGGELAHWGVHMLDVARWGLSVDIPNRVSAVGGKYSFDDDQETPDTLSVQYDFGDRAIQWEHRLWSSSYPEGRSSAVAFYGDKGTLIVDRGGWKVYDSSESAVSENSELLGPHLQNFIESIRNRSTPHADIVTGVSSANLCHWGNLAYRSGGEIRPNGVS
ncbi:MAG: Gfo/Idh/MocA family oxidoreductase [Planctomycetes bacterium]|nr:Gfo/Idh/MocA family oxidoreductase [Planctomycetota bacterium]